jgi:hypothetical protein
VGEAPEAVPPTGAFGVKELIGQRCACVFDLPHTEWPISGYPAWVVVVAVDMPMVCLKSDFGHTPIWVNAATIKTISARGNHYSDAFEAWWKESHTEFGGGVRYKYAASKAWDAGASECNKGRGSV